MFKKVLWITNIMFPEAQMLLTGHGEFKASGGWIIGAAEALLQQYDEVELHIASISNNVSTYKVLKGEKIIYHIIPYGRGNLNVNSEYEKYFKLIKDNINPDIVHIYGTEYSHGLAYINACSADRVVVSIQGMTSVYARYFDSGLSFIDIISNISIYDLINGGIFKNKYIFSKRGKFEKEILKKVNHVIGRTSWDRAHTWAIKPDINYHFCNEILREDFYDGSLWSYDKCDKFRIFLSQATYSIKGLHQLLKAMPLVLKHYPKTKIVIAGADISKYRRPSFIFQPGYGRYINKLIKKYNLKNNIEFLGRLSAKEMKEQYLKANIFICPSTIENSPNSLGEAQILGVPVISSYVGGVADMMQNTEEYMYRFEEVEMLAFKICSLFANQNTQKSQSDMANLRHSPKVNTDVLYDIYCKIAK